MAGQILPACVCIASRRHLLSLAGHPERSRNHFVHSWIFLCARCAEFCMKFYERIIAASLPERSFFPASDGESLPLLCLDLFQAQLFSADDGYSPCLFFIILFFPPTFHSRRCHSPVCLIGGEACPVFPKACGGPFERFPRALCPSYSPASAHRMDQLEAGSEGV